MTTWTAAENDLLRSELTVSPHSEVVSKPPRAPEESRPGSAESRPRSAESAPAAGVEPKRAAPDGAPAAPSPPEPPHAAAAPPPWAHYYYYPPPPWAYPGGGAPDARFAPPPPPGYWPPHPSMMGGAPVAPAPGAAAIDPAAALLGNVGLGAALPGGGGGGLDPAFLRLLQTAQAEAADAKAKLAALGAAPAAAPGGVDAPGPAASFAATAAASAALAADANADAEASAASSTTDMFRRQLAIIRRRVAVQRLDAELLARAPAGGAPGAPIDPYAATSLAATREYLASRRAAAPPLSMPDALMRVDASLTQSEARARARRQRAYIPPPRRSRTVPRCARFLSACFGRRTRWQRRSALELGARS